MPTETKNPAQPTSVDLAKMNVAKANMELTVAVNKKEAERKAKPATVEMVETVIARLDGLHYQSINNLKYLAEFKTELEKAKAFIDSAKVTVDKSKMSLTDKLWVVALSAWIVLTLLQIGKLF